MTIARPRTSGPRQRPPAPRRGRLGVQGGRAAFLATGPTAWYDARDLLATTQQTLTNRVGTGSATLGSTGTSDTNDPQALTHSGTNYVYVPGDSTTNNTLTVTSITLTDKANPELLWVGSIENVTSTKNELFGVGGFGLYANTAGNLQLWLTTTTAGTAFGNFGAHGFTAGATYYVRVRRVKATGVNTAEKSTDGANWTTIGSFTHGAGEDTVPASTTISVGALSPGLGLTNSSAFTTRRAAIGTTGGTYQVDINPAVETLGQASWTCTTGQTVTVNRSTSGLTTSIVTRPVLMADGTDDYVQLPAGDTPTFTATTGAYTALVVARIRDLAATKHLWSAESSLNVGAISFITAAGVFTTRIGGATTTASATIGTALDDGALRAFAYLVDAGSLYAYESTAGLSAPANITGVGAITYPSAPRVGSRAYAVSDVPQAEILVSAHWNRALTVAELNTASAFLLGSYA